MILWTHFEFGFWNCWMVQCTVRRRRSVNIKFVHWYWQWWFGHNRINVQYLFSIDYFILWFSFLGYKCVPNFLILFCCVFYFIAWMKQFQWQVCIRIMVVDRSHTIGMLTQCLMDVYFILIMLVKVSFRYLVPNKSYEPLKSAYIIKILWVTVPCFVLQIS